MVGLAWTSMPAMPGAVLLIAVLTVRSADWLNVSVPPLITTPPEKVLVGLLKRSEPPLTVRGPPRPKVLGPLFAKITGPSLMVTPVEKLLPVPLPKVRLPALSLVRLPALSPPAPAIV